MLNFNFSELQEVDNSDEFVYCGSPSLIDMTEHTENKTYNHLLDESDIGSFNVFLNEDQSTSQRLVLRIVPII